MKPYYERDGITIYHGDCREILPTLQVDAVVSDPPYGTNNNCDYTRFTGGQRENSAMRQGVKHERIANDDSTKRSKITTEDIDPDNGEVIRTKETSISYLPPVAKPDDDMDDDAGDQAAPAPKAAAPADPATPPHGGTK